MTGYSFSYISLLHLLCLILTPVIFALGMWLFFLCKGTEVMLSFMVVLTSGIIIYMFKARINNEWPLKSVSY